MSQRRKARLKRRLPAHFDNAGLPVHGIIRNFSEIGVFIQTNSMLPIGNVIQIRCHIENDKQEREEVVLEGRVVSVRNDPMMRLSNTVSSGGMGVFLPKIPPIFERYVARLRSQSGVEAAESEVVAPSTKSEAPQPAKVAPSYQFGRALAFSGNLGSGGHEFLVPDLLIMLWRQSFTGILHLTRGILKKTVYIKKGVPAYVESLLDSEKLGDYLIRRGALSNDKLGIALQTQQKSAPPPPTIGQILIDQGFIDSTALFEALNGQQEQKLVGAFSWFDGSFQLAQIVEWPEAIPNFSLRLHAMIFTGMERWFDPAVVQHLLPGHTNMVFKPGNPIEPTVQLPARYARLHQAVLKTSEGATYADLNPVESDQTLLTTLFVLLLYGWIEASPLS